ncbi:P-loop containing nucleoside triphosphate hydrolase [Trinorchestia longiramus]|nr:P-loop containing nucleoside triphosphate hydrolase [Trinorchestia longiramus]
MGSVMTRASFNQPMAIPRQGRRLELPTDHQRLTVQNHTCPSSSATGRPASTAPARPQCTAPGGCATSACQTAGTASGRSTSLPPKLSSSPPPPPPLLELYELLFLEASALTGENVEEAFLKCAKCILAKIETGELEPERIGSGIQYGDAALRKLRQPSSRPRPSCNVPSCPL